MTIKKSYHIRKVAETKVYYEIWECIQSEPSKAERYENPTARILMEKETKLIAIEPIRVMNEMEKVLFKNRLIAVDDMNVDDNGKHF